MLFEIEVRIDGGNLKQLSELVWGFTWGISGYEIENVRKEVFGGVIFLSGGLNIDSWDDIDAMAPQLMEALFFANMGPCTMGISFISLDNNFHHTYSYGGEDYSDYVIQNGRPGGKN